MEQQQTTARPAPGFEELAAANDAYAETFRLAGIEGRAAKGLALVTCMDSRIEPLQMLGLSAGDAKILRNAGARVTDDVLRTLVLAVHLLGVRRVLVIPHTRCRMTGTTEDQIHRSIHEVSGLDTRSLALHPVEDVVSTLALDLQRIRSFSYLPDSLEIAGAIYDVDTGRLDWSANPEPAAP